MLYYNYYKELNMIFRRKSICENTRILNAKGLEKFNSLSINEQNAICDIIYTYGVNIAFDALEA